MLNEPPGRWWLTPRLTPRLTWTTARLSELTQQAVLHLTRRIRAEHSWSAESQPKALTPHPRSLFLNLYSIDSDHVNYIWNKLGPVSVNSDESLFSRISDVSWLWDKDQTSVAVCCFATQTSVWLFMKTESLDFIIILHTSIDLASLQGTFLVCFLVVRGWLSPFWSQCFPTRIPLFVCFSPVPELCSWQLGESFEIFRLGNKNGNALSCRSFPEAALSDPNYNTDT